MSDKIDEAIAAEAAKPQPGEPHPDSIVAETELTRSGEIVRVIVPPDWGVDPTDFPATALLLIQLYDAAFKRRQQRPDGIELPTKSILTPQGPRRVQ